MGRVGLYVGNKEIVERYVGDNLVWRKERLRVVSSFVEKTWLYYSSSMSCRTFIWSLRDIPTGSWYNAIVQRGINRYQTSSVRVSNAYGFDNYVEVEITFNTTNEWRRFKSDVGYGSNVRVEVIVPY